MNSLLSAILVGMSTFVGINIATDNPILGVLIAVFGAYFAGLLTGINQ